MGPWSLIIVIIWLMCCLELNMVFIDWCNPIQCGLSFRASTWPRIIGVVFDRMMPEAMSLVDQRTTESVWCTKSSKAVKQVEWCLEVNKEVWCYLCLYQRAKSSKPLSKWKWCLAVNKTATKAASKYVFMQEMSVKTVLKQDEFSGSEERLDPEECNKLWYARSSMQRRDRVLLRLIGET